MRFCVNGRQPYSVIKKADEIKFSYNDRDRILDLVDKYSDKVIILDVPANERDWDTWAMYNEKFKEFHIALHDLSRIAEFNNHGIKWYWPFPITSYYELETIMDWHPSYVMLGPPLSFDFDNVFNHLYDPPLSNTTVPVRMVCNVAQPGYLPTANNISGICGQWVRPEDCKHYDSRVQCLEFEGLELSQEATMLDIYKAGMWPGNLNLIIQKLNFNVDNRAIPDEVGPARMRCGQRCWETGTCRLCIRALQFAENVRKERNARIEKELVDNK